MDASELLSGVVRAFHLETPDATWQELKERFRAVSVEVLAGGDTAQLWGSLHTVAYGRVDSLVRPQRFAGTVSASQSVLGLSPSQSGQALTFETLSALYLKDRSGGQKASTLSTTKFTHGVLIELLGELDMRNHTRADLVGLRDALAATRKPSTVNQMLMKLSAVLNWAVENGHLEKSYDKKLKFTKGIESTRKAFSQDQVGKLVAYANTFPETSWKRWLLSLGAITGARLNEISQLTVTDIQTLGSGVTAIHINEAGEGKSIKNKRSERMVPLTDGAYGFDLAAFLRYVDSCRFSGTEALAQIGYRPAGEWANQQAIPEALGGSYQRGLVFHSLRHSLVSLMQERGVPTTHAQAVMGHATRTITFDVYGSGVIVETVAEMLKGVFTPTETLQGQQ
ncbi:tyrosine-type recombinase/integrase [Pseudomonas protegens]|uniref:Tyrosine-type recombinase/integrase n=1 Tax=Pseudomonas protegens TaxID=380021 RepID=A0A7G7XIA7_9PSED|nr:tyrosine-type recombinase/integrase [Pseudomonas protegens]QNH79702.1 tyrosine-type recombinase/integrase [Pseudomonas protegens]QNL03129.1 tyrosine-type recombinase/integrase [Pseudomonas protegens]